MDDSDAIYNCSGLKYDNMIFKYIMETCGMIWNEYNENKILKNIH
jgi:hypothetical protein